MLEPAAPTTFWAFDTSWCNQPSLTKRGGILGAVSDRVLS